LLSIGRFLKLDPNRFDLGAAHLKIPIVSHGYFYGDEYGRFPLFFWNHSIGGGDAGDAIVESITTSADQQN
jgi:hypothetical protein